MPSHLNPLYNARSRREFQDASEQYGTSRFSPEMAELYELQRQMIAARYAPQGGATSQPVESRDDIIRRKMLAYNPPPDPNQAPPESIDQWTRIRNYLGEQLTTGQDSPYPIEYARPATPADYAAQGPAYQQQFRDALAAEDAPAPPPPAPFSMRAIPELTAQGAQDWENRRAAIERAGQPIDTSPEAQASRRRNRALLEIGAQSPEKAAEVAALLENTRPATIANTIPQSDLPSGADMIALQGLTPIVDAATFLPRIAMKALPGDEPQFSKDYLNMADMRAFTEQVPSRSSVEGAGRLAAGLGGEVGAFFIPGVMPVQKGIAHAMSNLTNRMAGPAYREVIALGREAARKAETAKNIAGSRAAPEIVEASRRAASEAIAAYRTAQAALPGVSKAAGAARRFAGGVVGFELPHYAETVLSGNEHGGEAMNPLAAPFRLVRDVLGDVRGSLDHPGVVNVLRNAGYYADLTPESLDLLRRNLAPATILALPMALHKMGDAGKAKAAEIKDALKSGDQARVQKAVSEMDATMRDQVATTADDLIALQRTITPPPMPLAPGTQMPQGGRVVRLGEVVGDREAGQMERAGFIAPSDAAQNVPSAEVPPESLTDALNRARQYGPPRPPKPPSEGATDEASARTSQPEGAQGGEATPRLEGAGPPQAARPQQGSRLEALAAGTPINTVNGMTLAARFNEWLESSGRPIVRSQAEFLEWLERPRSDNRGTPEDPNAPSMTEQFLAWAQKNPSTIQPPAPTQSPTAPAPTLTDRMAAMRMNPVPEKPGGFSLTAALRARMMGAEVKPDMSTPAKVDAPVTDAPRAKEPWEMTREEYDATPAAKDVSYDIMRASARDAGKTPLGDDLRASQFTWEQWKNTPHESTSAEGPVNGKDIVALLDRYGSARGEHAIAVAGALRAGKPVPPEVLADYPDLAAKYASQAAPASEQVPPFTPDTPRGSVYRIRFKDKGEMYAVRESDNPRGGGDPIFESLADARKHAEGLPERDRVAQEQRESREAAAREKAEQEAAAKAKRENLSGFGDDLPPMKKALAVKVLDAQMRSDGKVYKLRDLIAEKVQEGFTVEEKSSHDAAARKKLEAEFGRIAQTAPIGNENHPQTQRYLELKKNLADPSFPQKTTRVLSHPDGRFNDSFNKTALDYAEHLIKARNESPARRPGEATVETTPAATPEKSSEAVKADERQASSQAEGPKEGLLTPTPSAQGDTNRPPAQVESSETIVKVRDLPKVIVGGKGFASLNDARNAARREHASKAGSRVVYLNPKDKPKTSQPQNPTPVLDALTRMLGFSPTAPKSRQDRNKGDVTPAQMNPASWLRKFQDAVPGFKKNPVFVEKDGKLFYDDRQGGTYRIEPTWLGIERPLNKGERVRVDFSKEDAATPAASPSAPPPSKGLITDAADAATKTKFKKQPITVAIEKGKPSTFEANVSGEFAYHRPLGKDGKPERGGGYVITHVPTGRVVGRYILTTGKAKETIAALQRFFPPGLTDPVKVADAIRESLGRAEVPLSDFAQAAGRGDAAKLWVIGDRIAESLAGAKEPQRSTDTPSVAPSNTPPPGKGLITDASEAARVEAAKEVIKKAVKDSAPGLKAALGLESSIYTEGYREALSARFDAAMQDLTPEQRQRLNAVSVPEVAERYLPRAGEQRKTPAEGTSEREAYEKKINELEKVWEKALLDENEARRVYESKRYGTKTRDMAGKKLEAAKVKTEKAWTALESERSRFGDRFVEDRAFAAKNPVAAMIAAYERALNFKGSALSRSDVEARMRDAAQIKQHIRDAIREHTPIAEKLAGDVHAKRVPNDADVVERALDATVSDVTTEPYRAKNWLDWYATKIRVARRDAAKTAFESELKTSGLTEQQQQTAMRKLGDYPTDKDFDAVKEYVAEQVSENTRRAGARAEAANLRKEKEPAIKTSVDSYVAELSKQKTASAAVTELSSRLMQDHALDANDARDTAIRYLQEAIKRGDLVLGTKTTKDGDVQTIKKAPPNTSPTGKGLITDASEAARVEAAKEVIKKAVKDSQSRLGTLGGTLEPYFNKEFARAVGDLASIYTKAVMRQGYAQLLEYTEAAFGRFKEFLATHLPEHADVLGQVQGGKFLRRVWARAVASQRDLKNLGVAEKKAQWRAREAFVTGEQVERGRVSLRKAMSEARKDAKKPMISLELTHGLTPQMVNRIKGEDRADALRAMNEVANPLGEIGGVSEAIAALEKAGGKVRNLTPQQIDTLASVAEAFSKVSENARALHKDGKILDVNEFAVEGAGDVMKDKPFDLDRRPLTSRIAQALGLKKKDSGDPFQTDAGLRENAMGILRYIHDGASEPYQMIENFFGRASKVYDYFFNSKEGVRAGDTLSKEAEMRARDPVEKVLVDLGMNRETEEAKFRTEKRKFKAGSQELTLTGSEALDLYNHLRASGGNGKRIEENGFKLFTERNRKDKTELTDQDAQSFVDNVPENIRRLSDAMMESGRTLHGYWARMYERIFGVRAGDRGPNYWSIMTDTSMRRSLETTLDKYLPTGDLVDSPFTKARAEMTGEPMLITDGLAKWRSMVTQQSRYAGLAEPLLKMRAIINHPDVRDALVRKYGQKVLDKFNTMLEIQSGFRERMGGPEVAGVNKWIKDKTTSVTGPLLAGSLRAQVMSNVTGALQYMKEVDARDFNTAAYGLAKDIAAGRYGALREALKENGYLHNRLDTPTRRLLTPTEWRGLDPTEHKMIEVLNRMSEWVGKNFAGRGDDLNTVLAYKIAEAKAAREGKNPSRAELLTEAEKLVRLTQNPSSLLDMSVSAVDARKTWWGSMYFFIQNGALKARSSLERSIHKGGTEAVKGIALAGLETLGGRIAQTAQWAATALPFMADNDKRKDPGRVAESNLAQAVAEVVDLIVPGAGIAVRQAHAASRYNKAPNFSPLADVQQAMVQVGGTAWGGVAEAMGLRKESKTPTSRKLYKATLELLRAMAPFYKIPPQFMTPLREAMREKPRKKPIR